MKHTFRALFLSLLCTAALSGAAMALGGVESVQSSYEFLAPAGVLLQADGGMLVADGGNHTVVRLKDGTAQVVAGHTLPAAPDGRPAGGYHDGSAAYALFDSPFALVEWNGGIAVSDRGNNCLRLISNGMVKTLAGSGKEGLKNGPAASAEFRTPMGLAVDDAGTLYIADSGNGCIRTLKADGTVSTYVSGLQEPVGLCWADGVLYVTDAGTHRVLSVRNGVTAEVAGSAVKDGEAWIGGFADGTAAAAEFTCPFGVWADGGVLYVADTGNSAIRKIANGRVSTIATYDGRNGDLWPGSPAGLALDGSKLYAADAFAGRVLRIDVKRQLFTDVVADSVFAEDISYAYTSGMMNGVGGGKFSTGTAATRGQVVTMLYRLNGQPETTGGGQFADVAAEAYYADAVAWASAAGIVTGYSDGTFRPNNTITREQMATILLRYAAANGMMAVTLQEHLTSFSDGNQVSSYAISGMNWAVDTGILRGSNGKLLPRSSVTRAQLAAILSRYDQAQG